MGSAFVNGMLHLAIYRGSAHQDVIVAVNGEGDKCRIIDCPKENSGCIVFLGQSQGLLHCISGHLGYFGNITELFIWVLEDYNAEKLGPEAQCELFASVSKSKLLCP
jgi:hypothetical protein